MMKVIAQIMCLLLAVAGTGIAPMAAAEIEIHRQQSTRYASGGITPEEVKEMQKLAPRFPVQLYFRSQGSDRRVRYLGRASAWGVSSTMA